MQENVFSKGGFRSIRIAHRQPLKKKRSNLPHGVSIAKGGCRCAANPMIFMQENITKQKKYRKNQYPASTSFFYMGAVPANQ